MKHQILKNVVGGLFVVALAATPGTAQAGKGMTGYQAVPAVSTSGTGTCKVKAAKDGSSLDVELTYSGLEGAITQAHIHLGQLGVNGAITAFICTNLGNGSPGTPACPASPSTVTRTLVAADIVGTAAAQGIAAGELAEVIAAVKKRATYCDVHTDVWPGGETRQQLK